MSYEGYDAVIYFILTSLRAIALGMAVTVAMDVLPGRLRARITLHWTVVGIWALAVIWANLALHENVGLHPRATNVLVEAYLIMLLALHAWRGPWTDSLERSRASRVLKAIRQLERTNRQGR